MDLTIGIVLDDLQGRPLMAWEATVLPPLRRILTVENGTVVRSVENGVVAEIRKVFGETPWFEMPDYILLEPSDSILTLVPSLLADPAEDAEPDVWPRPATTYPLTYIAQLKRREIVGQWHSIRHSNPVMVFRSAAEMASHLERFPKS